MIKAKSFVSFILFILFGMGCMNTYAYDFEVDGIYYNIISQKNKTVSVAYQSYNEETWEITSDYEGDVVIPSTVTYDSETYTVTMIGGAFKGCTNLTSVTIPNSVTVIGASAFFGCSSLTSVNIPGSVKTIGQNAFRECNGLTSLDIPNNVTMIEDGAFCDCSGLTTVIIPNNLKKINRSVFANCSSLTSITIPESITSIGENAFTGSGLTSLTIPESITTIGVRAFYGCSSLVSLTILSSVKEIGNYAFANCTSLTSVNVSDLAAWCGISFGRESNPLSFGHLYVNGEEITDLLIPDGVTEIGSCAFQGCSYLTSVTIPSSVTKIGSSAFADCTGLTSLSIPGNVVDISNRAFYHCTGLTSLTLSEGIETIGESAFQGCSGLTTVTIPNSVKEMGWYAFWDCDLTSPLYNATNFFYMDWSYEGKYEIPEGIERISDWAFHYCYHITEITIPSSVTYIGQHGFSLCQALTSIVIPDKVTYIGEEAFVGCNQLTSVTLPDNVEYIGDKAFDDTPWYTNQEGMVYIGNTLFKFNGTMPENTEIVIKEGTTRICPQAFQGCNGLISISIPNSVTEIGNNAFSNCSSLTSITIPGSTTTIGYSAFYGCSSLTSITIPANVKEIGSSAFEGCNSLVSVIIEDGEEPISIDGDGSYFAFACPVETLYLGRTVSDRSSFYQNPYWGQTNLSSLTIGNYVTEISPEAFASCSNLTSVDIPNSVVTIGGGAFRDCTGLTSIVIPNSVTSIGNGAFSGCTGLTTLSVPNSVTNIGWDAFFGTPWYDNQPDGLVYAGSVAYKYKGTMPDNTELVIKEGTASITGGAFSRCSGLTSIKIPESVTSIDDSSFGQCRGLNTLIIPEGVTSIGDDAFSGCYSLNSLVIPKSLTTIGLRAFSYCYDLTSVRSYITTPFAISEDVFSYIGDNPTLYVPYTTKANYEATDGWNMFQNIVEMGPEPYVTLTGVGTNGQTLTFYYDNQKEDRGGMEIGPFAEYDNRPWGGDQQVITEVVFDASFAGYTALTSTAYWFASIASLNTIIGIENLKTDNVTDMREMFAGCMSLTSLDLSRFNTSNVTDMQYMFAGCDILTTIYVGNGWDVSKVTNSDEMFSGCFNLKGGAGTEFNQGQMGVTYAHVDGGENNPGYLTYLEDLDARKEELNMLIGEIYERLMVIKEMLEEKDPNRAATELWETLNQLEEEDVEISLSLEDAQTEADIDNIERDIEELEERVSQLHEEVENYGLIAEVEPYAVLSNNNTVLTFYYDDQKAARNGMSVGPFYYYYEGNDQGQSILKDTRIWTEYANTITTVVFDNSFANCTTLTSTALWFDECHNLSTINGIEYLKTDNVTDMQAMFANCWNLTSIDLSGFNTNNVTDFWWMFQGCSNLKEIDVSGFNTANAKNMSHMFQGCSSLMILDVSGFNTSIVTDMNYMFNGCSSLTTIYAGEGWSTIAVENSENMFTGCYSLKGGRGTEYTQDHTDVAYAHIDGGTANPGYFTSRADIEERKAELEMRLSSIHHQLEEIEMILQEKDPNQKATGLWQGLHFLNEDFITIHAVLEDAQTVTDLDDCEHKITELEDEVAHLFEEVVNYSENTDPIAYGVFTNNMRKLTFYYDTNMGTHDEGIVIPWEQLLNSNEMNNARQTLEIIDFDPSFVGFNTLTTTGYLFSGCMNLMAINGLEYLVTDNMTDMREMFASCESLTELDLRTFNTSRVTMMWGMFQGCIHLTTIIVGPGWTTAALTDEGHEMFAGCNSLVGGLGTTYSDEHFNADYAHIDGGPSYPGYLTGTEEPVITEFEVDGIFYRVHDQAEHRVTVAHVMRAEDELFVPFEVEYARIHWIVTALGEMAFTDLEQVKVIGVPESIDSVSVNLFNHCPHLAAIIWNANVPLTVTAMGQFNNPNLLLYIMNTANAPASVTNVIDMTTYMADKIVLSDAANGGNDFYCPEHFMAKEISYTHSYDQATQIGICQGWESIVVPFDVQTYTHETKGEIYPISTLLDEQIELDGDKPFWLYAFTSNDEFVEAEQIRANTPYILSMPNDPAYWDDYILSGRVTFSAKGVEVYPTRNVISVESQSRVFVPNFDNMDYENPDIFLLNVGDAYENHLPGSIFSGERPARRARPFEAYFIPTGNYPARYMDIFSSEVDAIREIPMSSKTKEGIYDLMGRRVKSEEWRVEGNNSSTHQLQKGVYIIDGKKVMVK